MNRRSIPTLLITVLLVACTALPGMAAETVPINITSDSMAYEPGENLVRFTGSVKAVREDWTITAQELAIAFKGKAGAGAGVDDLDPGEMEKITARGAVRILRGESVGTCETAVYDVDRGVFTMQGNPKLTEGKNSISGEVIRFYLKDNRSEVVGGKKRVNATFFTPKKEGEAAPGLDLGGGSQ